MSQSSARTHLFIVFADSFIDLSSIRGPQHKFRSIRGLWILAFKLSLLKPFAFLAGKGMHSRLYRNVLNAHYWMHNCVSFSSLYNDTGILGIISSAESQFAGKSVDVMCQEMLVWNSVPKALCL